MIRVSVLYQAGADDTFDHDYYRDKHIPLAQATWNPLTTEIDRGVDGPHVAAVHMTFESLETMSAAMGLPESAAVKADVANYTTITPVVQVSEIVSS